MDKKLYIDKWWGNYIGSCDDSLLLLDYFGNKKEKNLSLSEILSDLHIDTMLAENSVNQGDAYFSIDESYMPHFDLAIDVIIDLSTILLEYIKNGELSISDFDESSEYTNKIYISVSEKELKLLLSGLKHFIDAPYDYELANYMDENSLKELVNDCQEVYDALSSYERKTS